MPPTEQLRCISPQDTQMLFVRYEVHETKQPSVQPSRLTERQTHILTVNTKSFFVQLLSFEYGCYVHPHAVFAANFCV